MGQPVNCIGVHQVKAKQPTQDSFTCTSLGGPLGYQTPGAPLYAPYGWYSDFDGTYTTNISGTVSADGMSYTGVAIYS